MIFMGLGLPYFLEVQTKQRNGYPDFAKKKSDCVASVICDVRSWQSYCDYNLVTQIPMVVQISGS